MEFLFKSENNRKLKILVFLFKECNNNCDFCFQKGYPGIPSIEYFKKNTDVYIESLRKCLETSSKYDEISVNLMGGEMFHEYESHNNIIQILDFLKSYNNITVRFTSNLIQETIPNIIKCLEFSHQNNINLEFFTSFDFGPVRFKDKQNFRNFKMNLLKIRSLSEKLNFKVGMEVIRTKYMLKAYEDENDEFQFIRQMSSRILISQNELIGDKDYRLSSDESVKLWKLVLTKTPLISDIKSHFFEQGRNCLNIDRLTILSDKILSGCKAQKYKPVESYSKKDDIKKLISHYNCSTCEYCNRCSLKCPIEQYYDKCDKKEVFRFCDENHIKL